MLTDATKQLPEPMLPYQQWGPQPITWGQFHNRYVSPQLQISFKFPRGQWILYPYIVRSSLAMMLPYHFKDWTSITSTILSMKNYIKFILKNLNGHAYNQWKQIKLYGKFDHVSRKATCNYFWPIYWECTWRKAINSCFEFNPSRDGHVYMNL